MTRVRHASEGSGIERRQRCIAHDELDGSGLRSQLLGDDLGSVSTNVLANFDLPGEDGNQSVFSDVQQAASSLAGHCRRGVRHPISAQRLYFL
jgi:hypothetical protein